MIRHGINRSEFVRGGCCLAAGSILSGLSQASAAERGVRPEGERSVPSSPLLLRPFQLLCLVCALGEDPAGPKQGKLKEIREAIGRNPDLPISLRCNAGDVYVFQDPGTGEDTPEGREFNRKRDLDILQKMGWPPGITLPARTLLLSLVKHITTVAGVCGYDRVTAEEWKGCAKAHTGYYEKGRERGIDDIVPPRTEKEMAAEKVRSVEVLNSASVVTSRPHILLCAVCQYGGGTRPPFKPDNLPELIELVFVKNKDLSIRFAEAADWMMCAPCPNRASASRACVNTLGSGGLSNQKRDLDMMQMLGMHYGSTMKAKELFRLIFERIPTTQAICRREGNASPCVWWDGCGESNTSKGNASYEKGRKELMKMLSSG